MKKLMTVLLVTFLILGASIVSFAVPVNSNDIEVDGIVFRFESYWMEFVEFNDEFEIALGIGGDVSVSVVEVYVDGINVTDQIEAVHYTVDGVTSEDFAILNHADSFSVSIKLANGNSIEREHTYRIIVVEPK